MIISAKKYGKKQNPYVLGKINSELADTPLNRRILRRKIIIKYPQLDFFTFTNIKNK